MNENLDLLWEVVQQSFTNPAADLRTSTLVFAIVIFAALILVLAALLALTPKKRRVVKVVRGVRRPGTGATGTGDVSGEKPEKPETEKPAATIVEGWVDEADRHAFVAAPASDAPTDAKRRKASGPTTSILVAVLLGLALVSGYGISGTDVYCAQFCHAADELVISGIEIDHAPCRSCHEVPGAAGVVANTMSRARMIAAYVVGERQTSGAAVDSRTCVRCHRDVTDGAIQSERGIRMSHKEPFDAGVTCLSCHEGTGHDERRHYSMSSCIVCHDGATASTECESCHVGDPYAARGDGSTESTLTVGSGKIMYPVTLVGDRPCGGCHDEVAECDTCHGLRMPHDGEFIEGRHARYSAFEKKQSCRKCHTEQWCSAGCHIGFPGHAPGWKEEHKRSPRDAGCGCHAARSGRTEPMCVLCHDW